MHAQTPERLMADLGREIRAGRAAQGLRQDELALAAGVSTRTVHAIENGKATARIDVLLRVLSALGYEAVIRSRHASPQRESTGPSV